VSSAARRRAKSAEPAAGKPNEEDSSMYAILRHNTYDTGKLAEPALAEFQALHTTQPGYVGSIVVDVGGGQRLSVNLWESERDANAGQAVLVPHVQRLLEPLMAAPSRFVGAGEVVTSDISRTGPAQTPER